MKTFDEFYEQEITYAEEFESHVDLCHQTAQRAWNAATEAAKPRWLPILPETLFDADTDYLVRRKDEQYDDGYDVQLCQYANDIFGMFFWWNGNDEFPQGYFDEYMEIPK